GILPRSSRRHFYDRSIGKPERSIRELRFSSSRDKFLHDHLAVTNQRGGFRVGFDQFVARGGPPCFRRRERIALHTHRRLEHDWKLNFDIRDILHRPDAVIPRKGDTGSGSRYWEKLLVAEFAQVGPTRTDHVKDGTQAREVFSDTPRLGVGTWN